MIANIHKIQFKKIISVSLLVAFITSVISDVAYGKAALAQEYMIGQFLSTISALALSLVTIFVIFWLMFKFILKYLFENFVLREYSCSHSQQSEDDKEDSEDDSDSEDSEVNKE